jgi:periplasmic protein TonB
MFETTLEAQALDGRDKRFGTISAAAAAHLGILIAFMAVTAIIVPPVRPPEPPEPITVILPPPIPIAEPSPPPAPVPPLRGNEQAGATPTAPTPPPDPVVQPFKTPEDLPIAPPSDAPPTDGSDTGVPSDGPFGDGSGTPGGSGAGPSGNGDDPNASSVLTLTGDMVRPVLLTKVEPVYPTTARIARMEGRVTVEAVIGLDGRVESAEVIASTSPLFDDAALDAVRRWRYRPALMNGRPVRVYYKFAVGFVIR